LENFYIADGKGFTAELTVLPTQPKGISSGISLAGTFAGSIRV
jgi:hypothetical protein